MAGDDMWTLARIAAEEPALAPLARLHSVLADETVRFATDGDGPAPRTAFGGPPAVHWLAGRPLLSAMRDGVVRGLTAPLTERLARRVAAEFEDVADAASEVAAFVGRPEFPWQECIDGFCDPPPPGVPHAPLFRFLLLRALAAPATHLARSFSAPPSGRWLRRMCPFCGLPPAASVARPGGERWLLCVLCGGRWTVPGMACPSCGEDDGDRLRVLAAPAAGPATLEACDTCGLAVKVFADGALVPGPPLALEILTIRLDLVAERDEGVRRAPAAVAALFPPA